MPNSVTVTVDTRGLTLLAQQYDEAGKVAMIRLLAKGEEHIRTEAPKRTGRLKGKRSAGGSVSSEYKKTGTGYAGEINVSAIRERLNAATGTAVSARGRRKAVQLRAQPAFDYAEVVATGRPRLTAPKRARAFIRPAIARDDLTKGYLLIDGEQYVVRRSIEATKPNDYPGRALQRLSAEAEGIVLRALQDVLR